MRRESFWFLIKFKVRRRRPETGAYSFDLVGEFRPIFDIKRKGRRMEACLKGTGRADEPRTGIPSRGEERLSLEPKLKMIRSVLRPGEILSLKPILSWSLSISQSPPQLSWGLTYPHSCPFLTLLPCLLRLPGFIPKGSRCTTLVFGQEHDRRLVADEFFFTLGLSRLRKLTPKGQLSYSGMTT